MIAASIWLDTADLKGTSFLVHAVADWGPRVVRILAAFAIFSLVFWNTDREAFGRIYQASDARFSLSFGLAHLALAFVFWRISSVLFGARPSDSLVWTWVICGVLTVTCAALTFLSASLWIKIVRSLRDMLIFGAGAALGAALVDSVSGFLWRPASSATFSAVRTILRLFLTNPISDAATLTIGGPKFSVFISPQCSGIEGIGLMLAFGCAWLWFFRREYRFPRALLLIPVGIGAIWLANAVRIAVLVLIGEAGAERIALGGFHSQAGWIAFLAVALAFSAGSRRLRWLCVAGPAPGPSRIVCACIESSGTLSHAASGDLGGGTRGPGSQRRF